jgi:hypothetical protein
MPTPALHHGPYGTPSVIPGCYVTCLFRGVVKLVGLSSGAIPWPIGEKDGERALVVYRGLARALTCKPAEGIAAAWGVPLDAVKQWQATLRPKPERKPPPKRKLNNDRRWTAVDDNVVLSISDPKVAAQKVGRTPGAVRTRKPMLTAGFTKAADKMRKPRRKRRRR